MRVNKSKDSSPLLVHRIIKHGSHNQASHGRGGGSSGGGMASGGVSEPTEMPFRPSSSDALSQKLMSDVPRGEANAAYVKGFKEGKTATPAKIESAKGWHDMTARAVEAGQEVSQTYLKESIRAIGMVNGSLS